MEHLPVYICAACRENDPEGERRPLVNLKPKAARRLGLEHQSVHVECYHRIRAGWRPTA